MARIKLSNIAEGEGQRKTMRKRKGNSRAMVQASPASKRRKMSSQIGQDVFEVKFSAKSIYKGRYIDFDSLLKCDQLTGLVELFKEQQWIDLLKENLKMYPELVHQFYGNMDISRSSNGILKTRVLNKEIKLTPDYLGEVLGIPSTGYWDYPGKRWSRKEEFDVKDAIKVFRELGDDDDDDGVRYRTKPETVDLPFNTRFLHLVVMQTVLGRGGNKNSFTFNDAYLMYFMMKKQKVNLPRIMMEFMTKVVKKTLEKKGMEHLPYGMWLTKVFMKEFGDLASEAPDDKKCKPISLKTVTIDMGYFVDDDGALEKKPDRRTGIASRATKAFPGVARRSAVVPDHRPCMLQGLVIQGMLVKAFPDIFTGSVMKGIIRAAEKKLNESPATGASPFISSARLNESPATGASSLVSSADDNADTNSESEQSTPSSQRMSSPTGDSTNSSQCIESNESSEDEA